MVCRCCLFFIFIATNYQNLYYKEVEDLSAASLWLTFSGGLGMFIYLSGEKFISSQI